MHTKQKLLKLIPLGFSMVAVAFGVWGLFFSLYSQDSSVEGAVARLQALHEGHLSRIRDSDIAGNPLYISQANTPAVPMPMENYALPGKEAVEAIPRPDYGLLFSGESKDGIAAWLAFPPQGLDLKRFPAKIYYPLQQRFAPVEVKTVLNAHGVYLYGAALCEEEENGQVVLSPCIFMENIPFAMPAGAFSASPLETEIGRALKLSGELEFYPWARYATSHLGCGSEGSFRISIQFGASPEDTLVSLSVPYSSAEKNALFDLAYQRTTPCAGLDLFFDRATISELILNCYEAKEKALKEKNITRDEESEAVHDIGMDN